MRKKFTYILLIALFFAGTAFIIIKYKKQNSTSLSYYGLKERSGPQALTAEWKRMKTTVQNLYVSVTNDPKNIKSALQLAAIFIKEARISGNYSYYDIAAMQQVNHVLELEPDNFEALTYKALIYLSQHHFADGVAIAKQAQQLNPYNAYIYGILVDGNVENGNYSEAINDADKMVAIRPDLASYSRISYLREIYGDYAGAIEAMTLAVTAGLPGDESTEWCRTQLGHLYENTGKTDSAEFEYKQSLAYRNGYAPAIAGLGRIAISKNDYTKAIEYYKQADTIAMDYTYKENLAALYKATGQMKESDSVSTLVINAMSNDANAAANDNTVGHYVDRELAYAYLATGENEKGLQHALAEYNRRPDNIDVNETLAWAYYKNADVKKAISYIEVALKTNSKNPVLLNHAGLIYAKAGNKIKAKYYLGEALKADPVIDIELKKEAKQVLENI